MKKQKFKVYTADKEFFKKVRSQHSLAYVSQSRTEEIFNTLTHALGTFLAIIGSIVIISYSAGSGETLRIVTTAIYGLSLIFMYTASMLYHGFTQYRLKKFFHLLDHSAIFVFIAGANTPIMLLFLKDHWGRELFIASWILATAGVFLELFFSSRLPKYVSLTLYSLMGWMLLFAAKPMFEVLPSGLLHWLFAGGVTFMLGIYFYVKKTLFFNHVIWHIFVLVGTIFHYIGMLSYIAMKCN